MDSDLQGWRKEKEIRCPMCGHTYTSFFDDRPCPNCGVSPKERFDLTEEQREPTKTESSPDNNRKRINEIKLKQEQEKLNQKKQVQTSTNQIKSGLQLIVFGLIIYYFFLGGSLTPKPDQALLECSDVTYDPDLEMITLRFKNKGRQTAENVVLEIRQAGIIEEEEISSGESWSIWANTYVYIDVLPVDFSFGLGYEWTDSKGNYGRFSEEVFIEITKDDIT
ncbi:MAG: hypothetical protein NWE88_08740 [Candidatus Bathyarchaeota archaeon]|nr:hypothetical protein [Candidatus Bathyarchaeota archaeon]